MITNKQQQKINKLLLIYGNKINSYIEQNNCKFSQDYFIQCVVASDPDKQGKSVKWVLNNVLNGNILWEDVESGDESKVYDTLNRFYSIRQQFKDTKLKDINQFKRLGDIAEQLRGFEVIQSNKEIKKDKKEQIYKDTIFLYNQNGYLVIVPKTQESSCFWGLGTEWCTAATRSENYFNDYNESGPLYICITPDGKKYQFHIDSEPMDENDNPIYNITDPILIELSKHVGRFSHIKKNDFSNDEILKGYIMEKNSDLSIIPNKFIKKIEYNFILQYHYTYINQIPKDMITQEMLNNIVKSKFFIFKSFDNINKDIINKEMVIEFIKTKKCININQIPKEFLTEEILLEAMKNDDLNLSYHQYILTNNISNKMINSNYHYSLKFIKEEYQTKNLCFQSLEIKGFKEATYILLKNLTKEDWRKILNMGYYNSGSNIPKEFLDEEFYKLIVKNSLKDKNTTMIYNIKKEYIDFEDYCDSIKLDVSKIFSLNPEMDDYKDLCKVAISINYEIYEELPKNIIKSPDMIKYIEEQKHIQKSNIKNLISNKTVFDIKDIKEKLSKTTFNNSQESLQLNFLFNGK